MEKERGPHRSILHCSPLLDRGGMVDGIGPQQEEQEEILRCGQASAAVVMLSV